MDADRPDPDPTGDEARPSGTEAALRSERTEELTPVWLSSVELWWDGSGWPEVLAGAGAAHLPLAARSLHVLTAMDPGGERQPRDRNLDRLRALVADVVARWGPPWRSDAVRWVPTGGSAPDGSRVELGVGIAGLGRGAACELAASWDQLAIYEATAAELLVVRCDDEQVTGRSARGPWEGPRLEAPARLVHEWRQDHWRALAAAGVDPPPVLRCPRCGADDLVRLLYGLPAGPPPPWLASMGCTVTGHDPSYGCEACGHRW